ATERIVTYPPRFIEEEDIFILRQLLLLPRLHGKGQNVFLLDPLLTPGSSVNQRVESEALLRGMLATGRLFTGTPPVILNEGLPRSGNLIWQELGPRRIPRIEASPPATAIFKTWPPWYLDWQEGWLGPLLLSLVPEAWAALQTEALPVSPFLLFPAASHPEETFSHPPDSSAESGPIIEALPRGLLHLASLEIKSMSPWRNYDAASDSLFDYAVPFFCYGEAALASDDDRESALLPDGTPVRIKRCVKEEEKLLAALLHAGLESVPAHLLHVLGRRPRKMYGLADEADWDAFMTQGIKTLQEAGWQIWHTPDFRHFHFEVEQWEVELREEKDNWLGLNMGVFVAGERLSLAPLLSNLFRREPRWLDALQLADIPDTETVYLLTENEHRIKVPAERIKPLARLIIDLFDGYKEGETTLRLSRFDALRLDPFRDTQRWQFRGNDAILALAERLKNSHGVGEVAPPRGIKLALRDYQRRGLAWLQYLREHNLSGILADDMGLGKTAQTLAHLLLEKESGRMTLPTLIILPTSLIFNWKNEAARFAPDLKVLSLHGQEREVLFSNIPKYDVVLTTYPLLWRDSAELTRYEYHLLVLDEAQMIKNARSKSAAIVRQLRARHRLCLTGTPLENHLGEIWTQFDFLLPGFLGDHKSFTRLWRNPIEKRGDLLRRDLLARRIHPFILRRKKDEVARELPEKTIIIRRVGLSGGQRDLYETVRAAMDKRVRAEIALHGFTRSQIVILDALLKLRQVCCDPRLVKSIAAKKIRETAKLNLLMDMLPEMVEEGRRILLFSQFTTMLDLIREELEHVGLPYVILTGASKERETPVNAFQDGKVPIFLISLKAGGVGLNLTTADTVIHYDPWWNPAVENQATDRAHRIGQDKPVFVYKLIVADSIEEKIIALQEQKADLVAGILSEQVDKPVKFDHSDLEALFEPLPEV
ncbi:MAG: DEAD/DEAH box helicase, partial [Zoogloeaceae bacterium]|nr:DEAD/DEAH box helicase [Zoogloeaceae bacterium]